MPNRRKRNTYSASPIKAVNALKWMKSKQYAHYKTLGELARAVQIDPRTIRRLEAGGIFPEPPRVKRGHLRIRLYSPQHEAEIIKIYRAGTYRKLKRDAKTS